jgi:hypothetical protein
MMMQQDYSDQTKIFDPRRFGYDIHFVGAGGASNSAILQVAAMGVMERGTIHVWDPDCLEAHNCATELTYSNKMIGQSKVDAAADALLYKFDNDLVVVEAKDLNVYDGPRPQVILHSERVTASTELDGIVVTGVDSMAARQEIWQAIKKQFWRVPLLIDLRSAGLTTLIVTFNPSDMEAAETYEETLLYSDKESMQLECGARNICFISAYFGVEVAHRISLFARNQTAELDENFVVPRDFI